MRFIVFFHMFIVFLAFPVHYASAELSWGKAGQYIWGPPNHDETRPHVDEAKIPHNSQWADDGWDPQQWIDDRGSAEAVINGFYNSGIVTDQYFDEDIPVLEVGQPFMDLSAQEQGRVSAFFDYVYHVTDKSERRSFLVYYHKNNEPLGVFTPSGLQLQ